MRIEVTATDRNGRRLETRVVEGPSFHATFEERGRVYAHLRAAHRDHLGLTPYIFTRTMYEDTH